MGDGEGATAANPALNVPSWLAGWLAGVLGLGLMDIEVPQTLMLGLYTIIRRATIEREGGRTSWVCSDGMRRRGVQQSSFDDEIQKAGLERRAQRPLVAPGAAENTSRIGFVRLESGCVLPSQTIRPPNSFCTGPIRWAEPLRGLLQMTPLDLAHPRLSN